MEFKVKIEGTEEIKLFGRDRNRVEFKVIKELLLQQSLIVEIETEWNLKFDNARNITAVS